MSDLSPEEWDEAVRLARAHGAEVGPDTVVVRSHVIPAPHGSADWVAWVEGTNHRARGNASSVALAFEAIEAALRRWYPEAAQDIDTWMTLVRQR